MKEAPITTARVDLKSGEFPARQWRERELYETPAEVRADHFKRKKAKLITADFRAKVLAGERPGLIYPGGEDCPVKQGQAVDLTPNVSIVVNRITKTKGDDHRCRYMVIDSRATLPRRTPGMFEPPETDAEGFPIPHTKEAIAAATIDGNYCQGSAQAVPDVAEEVDVEYRRVLGTKARAKEPGMEKAKRNEEATAKQLARKLARIQAEGAKYGVDLTPRILAMIREGQGEIAVARAREPGVGGDLECGP